MLLKLPVLVDVVGGGKAFGWKEYKIDLYANTDDHEGPKWWEHPNYGPAVDAVAIELKGLEDTITVAANDVSLGLERFIIWSGMDVFVLGFPKGISGGGGLPIWKRGSIASEPDVDLGGLPLFYIDTATRPGTSGSPVYARRHLDSGRLKARSFPKKQFSEPVIGSWKFIQGGSPLRRMPNKLMRPKSWSGKYTKPNLARCGRSKPYLKRFKRELLGKAL